MHATLGKLCYMSQLVNITENDSFHSSDTIVTVSGFYTSNTIAGFSRKLQKKADFEYDESLANNSSSLSF